MKLRALLLAIACCGPAPAAEQYWAYQYRQIDVVAQGNAEYAQTLARNLSRLDRAIATVLQPTTAPSSSRAPTHVFAMPADLYSSITGHGKESGSLGHTSPYGTTLLINTSSSGSDRYWSSYYAFGASVLGSSYSFRYPDWFISGLCEVFAATLVDQKQVTIGSANAGRVATVLRGSWIPLQTLLSLDSNDPQLKSSQFRQMYDAESWYLVHRIVIDQFYSANFYDYFKRLDRGEEEAKAFSASFSMSYEDLDKALKKTLSGSTFMQLKVAVRDEEDGSTAVHLTEAEAKARLALAAADFGVQPDTALSLAAASLKIDPANADAQAAKARAELRTSDFVAAYRDAESMCARDSLTPRVVASCAFVYMSLARKEADKLPAEVSQPDAVAKARKFYERGVQDDPNDLGSWLGLGRLTNDTRDAAYASTLLPRIIPAQAAHPHVGSMAATVAYLYVLTGDGANALKYAMLWQRGAMSGGERAAAAAFVAKLKSESDRRKAAGVEVP